ncbi:MAG: TIGR03564 family F420-dependent LLM class oxidoreductase [Dehalococcoidia bacterium]|nr:TIGR03564 family F420-dependent LLM class oxidoreductase [Dehalococcoidia bacterium]
MRISLLTGARGASVELHSLIQEMVQAEEDGFDSIWLPQVSSGPGFDALTALSLASTRTSRIELGTAVVPIFPIQPLTLAEHAITAQIASEGRLTLGVGLSHRPMIEDVMGLSYDEPARHMEEYLSVLRPLLDEGKVDFAGRFYKVKGQYQVPGALHVPVVVAALAPMMLRVAGEQADGTFTWMAGPKTVESHVVPRITRAAESVGRSEPRVCVGMPLAVTDDPQQARAQAAKTYQRYGELANYRRMLDLEGVEGPSEVALIGNEAEVAEQLIAYADAGATDFLASIFPEGYDEEGSLARSMALLMSLVGKV